MPLCAVRFLACLLYTSDVYKRQGFFCQNDSCKFAIWKNNKWWTAKKKQPTKAVVSALLKDGLVRVTGLYSEKTGKTYDATVVLEDDGQYANFKLEFDQRKGGRAVQLAGVGHLGGAGGHLVQLTAGAGQSDHILGPVSYTHLSRFSSRTERPAAMAWPP